MTFSNKNVLLINILICVIGLFILSGCGNDSDSKLPAKKESPAKNADQISSADNYNNDVIDTTMFAGSYSADLSGTNSTLKISKMNNDKFYFEMFTADESGCTGDITGYASFTEKSSAVFNDNSHDSECEITFIFNMDLNSIDVTEADCSYYHGMRCNFNGIYIKDSNRE